MTFRLEHYSIAIRKKEGKLLFEGNYNHFKQIKFPFSKRFWPADPFLIEYKDKLYLFYELFDNVMEKGVIAYSVLEGNIASKPNIILDKPYHLSFPNIFVYNDEFYMIPETAENKRIELYKSTDFPDTWHLERILVDNICACDSDVLINGDIALLYTSIIDKNLSNCPWCYVRNNLFSLTSKQCTNLNKQALPIGDFGIRNGGKFISKKDILIRVGQDCTNGEYGKGLVFWKVNNEMMDEELLLHIPCSLIDSIVDWDDPKHGKLKGAHTYNVTENFEVIDMSEFRSSPLYVKYVYKVWRKIIKLKQIYEK